MKLKIHNLIKKVSNYLISDQQNKQAQNIKYELSLRALKSTTDYVQKKMRNIISVDSKWRVHDLALKESSLNGIFLEFGVFKAETINYIAKKTNGRVYGFDSFEGLPEFWRDGFPQGAFSINDMPQIEKNVTLIKGWFNESLPRFLLENQLDNVAYLHIDCDLYSSTKTIFDNLKDKIVPGTVIVFDEYFNFPGWESDEYKAFQEFIAESGLNYKYITYNYMHEQVAVKIV